MISNHTHQVVSYLGSADFHDLRDGGQVNGASAIRQPGSTLKPLLYGICMDEGLLTPKQIINDVAVNYQGYAPENFDRKFNGHVTMEYALEHSLNIPAVRSLRLLGKDKMIQTLSACGFSSLQKDQNKLGLSMILGGCGASLEQLTGLFSIFANQGQYFAPAYQTGLPSPSLPWLRPVCCIHLYDQRDSQQGQPTRFSAAMAKYRSLAQDCLENGHFLWEEGCLEHWLQCPLYGWRLVWKFFSPKCA